MQEIEDIIDIVIMVAHLICFVCDDNHKCMMCSAARTGVNAEEGSLTLDTA